jgi:hypothetical protein
MKSKQLINRSQIGTSLKILISIFLLSSLALRAQTPTNFSGKWEFNKALSDKDENGDASFNGTIILEIRQTADSISFVPTYFLPGKPGIAMPPDTYPLNGKVMPDNSGSDPAKKFVKWSPDKKFLTANYIMTATVDGKAQDFITADTYKLSDDGKTLVIEDMHKSSIGGEKTFKKAYKKKP